MLWLIMSTDVLRTLQGGAAEQKLLDTIHAPSLADAETIARRRWPGRNLLVRGTRESRLIALPPAAAPMRASLFSRLRGRFSGRVRAAV